jgi:hypothetical protein
LRFDPVLALFSERLDACPQGKRSIKREDGAPLAGKSTINRLEHASRGDGDRYHKIGHDPEALEAVPVDVFLDSQDKAPREIVIDLDAPDDPLHGRQDGLDSHFKCKTGVELGMPRPG